MKQEQKALKVFAVQRVTVGPKASKDYKGFVDLKVSGAYAGKRGCVGR